MYIPLKPLFSRHKGIGVQFTDEPTGNLDNENSANIVEILIDMAHRYGKCVVVITHAMEVAEKADVILRMSDGVLATPQESVIADSTDTD